MTIGIPDILAALEQLRGRTLKSRVEQTVGPTEVPHREYLRQNPSAAPAETTLSEGCPSE